VFIPLSRVLWAKGEYKNGKEDGRWIYYYDSGQIRLKGTYKDGNRIQHPQGRIIECSKKGV
jgi:antitoxin component YwqK of YwqJK toxin-antitoxin module